jgi:hypothetical protein
LQVTTDCNLIILTKRRLSSPADDASNGRASPAMSEAIAVQVTALIKSAPALKLQMMA